MNFAYRHWQKPSSGQAGPIARSAGISGPKASSVPPDTDAVICGVYHIERRCSLRVVNDCLVGRATRVTTRLAFFRIVHGHASRD
jgi:hypothetical protein